MKQPLCWFIEIHWGKLKTSAASLRWMLRCHITGSPHSPIATEEIRIDISLSIAIGIHRVTAATRTRIMCKDRSVGEKKGAKRKQRSHHCHTLFFNYTQASLDWGWFEGQISWQGNFVRTTCRAADYPWASIIFVYQKMLIACFYEWEKIKS